MKFLLVALNAKYIHSNLAVHSLKAYAEKRLETLKYSGSEIFIEIAEYTINQPTEKILEDIYKKNPDVLMFSCYIWNIRQISDLADDISMIRKDLDIWLGGPEVSFDPFEIMDSLKNLKGVICGEGEKPFSELVRIYAFEKDSADGVRVDDHALRSVRGIVFRNDQGYKEMVSRQEADDISIIPFPYGELKDFDNRIIYYESSRGCPFRCSYCLSSVEKHLRFRDLSIVMQELGYFLKCRIPQVKFIDRTFNCDHQRAVSIWEYIKENDNGVTNFHFEIAADLLTEEELSLIRGMRTGQVQLEIGVQSTNRQTLKEINRVTDIERLKYSVSQIKKGGNVHIHLDLIAGLPFEDYKSFAKSFDDVFLLKPEQLQLGFLKVLKGSPIEKKCKEYGLKYTKQPPYEVLETRWISYDELRKLKGVEEMVEIYYNSRQFSHMLDILLEKFKSPFEFFQRLSLQFREDGSNMINISRNSRYEILIEFGKDILPEYENERFMEAAVCDYYLRDNVKNRPPFLGREKTDKRFLKEFYSREAVLHRYLKGGRYDTDDPRLLRKLTHLERLKDGYYLFDYMERSPMDNNARMVKIDY